MALQSWYSNKEYISSNFTLQLGVFLDSQSVENNTSTISWIVWLRSYDSAKITSTASKNCSFTINGQTFSDTNTISINQGGRNGNFTKSIFSGETTITHNSDGSQSLSFSVYQEIDEYLDDSYVEDWSTSGSMTLPSIPRAAKITATTTFTDESNPTITYDNPAGNSIDNLEACISLTGATDDIKYRSIPKTGTTYTFNLTDAERKVLRAATTGSNTRQVRFYVRTTVGSTKYLEYVSRTFSIVNGNPTMSPTAVDNSSSSIAELTGSSGNLIRYYSDVSVATNAAAVKEASLTSQKITCGSKTIDSSSGTFIDIESGTFTFTATDNRGNTTTKTITKNILDYVKLTCNLEAENPNAAGNMDFSIKGNYFNSSFGAVDNTLTVQYRYKVNDGEYGDWIDAPITLSGNTYSFTTSMSGLDYMSSYTFQAKAVDKLLTITTPEKTVKSIPVFDWGENDFNFNVPVNINGSDLTMNGETVLKHNTEANDIILSSTGGNIYIRPGGTTDTSSEVRITSQGDIEVKGDIIINGVSLTTILQNAGLM